MPYEEIHNTMYPNVKDDNAEMYIEAVEKIIKGNSFVLEYRPLNNNTEGYTSFEENKIVIDKNLTGVAKLKVMLHELAHSLAHTNLKNNYELINVLRKRMEKTVDNINKLDNKMWLVMPSIGETKYDISNKPYYLMENDIINVGHNVKQIFINFELKS